MSLNEQDEAASVTTSSKNSNLHGARKEKNDEFYTQLSDIERELKNYRPHFQGKVVFCNCDDPEWSNFYKYFTLNFEFLGLSKVITTHYAKGEQSYKLEYFGKEQPVVKTDLSGDGDFRSDECVAIIKEADIVVTNPPFSLFREYVAQLVENNKKFLIIGNNNAITYKEIFKLIKENRLWVGVSPRSMSFKLSDGSLKDVNANWFTNIPHKKRNEQLHSWKSYAGNESDYPKYDNYDAIEVSKVVDIPVDYHGVMGVPITFLDKYNPAQFQVLGLAASAGYSPDIVGIPFAGSKDARPLINNKNTYARVFISKKNPK